ncbi:MAG: hypothetical protein HOJ88_00805 [Proteobacteria bacterium]|nr:hypothetical protein [Pseudomonadota bacterium]
MAGFSLGKNKLPADVMSSCIIRPVVMQIEKSKAQHDQRRRRPYCDKVL